MEEECMARMKTCDGSSSSAGACENGGNNGGGKNSDKSRGGKQSVGGNQKSITGHNDVCSYCDKKGHQARECRKKKRDEVA
jgi:hypothetical protein